MAFHLASAAGGVVPFAIGFAFREGDVASNASLSTDFPEFQVTRKNAWPDGSLKFAILSGRANLQPNTLRTVALRVGGSASSGPAIGTSNLKATGISAAISFGSYGTAAWSGSDWDAPFQNWVSGPEMSSWVYRKPIGSDPHLVAWMEVRCWVNGQVEVVPWIENGYLNVPSPGERSGTATFTLGGTQRFSQSLTLLNHTRAVLASGTTLTHWLGADPQLSWKHDPAYFTSTKMVPNYVGSTSSVASALSSLATSYTPLAQSDLPPAMGATGYHKSIGMLPQWDVLYLTANADDRAWRAIQINSYCAGRYGIHFRDEGTNRAPRMSSYPNLCLGSGAGVQDNGASSTNSYTPAASGTTPPAFKTSHMPSLGYMAYLLTGRWYFMDEVQLCASMNFLKQTDTSRGGTQYLILSTVGANQVRGSAWGIRLLAQAASITPDDDTTMRAEYVKSVDNNIVRYHSTYVGNGDPVGAVQGQADFETDAGRQQSPWEDDFFTAAFAFMADQKVHSAGNQNALTQFLAWKFQYIVGRLGTGTGGNTFNFEYAATYRGTIAPVSAPDYAGKTGPWFSNWGEVAAAMAVPANTGSNRLQGTSGANPGEMSTGYWGNLHPAIAYAVDHGAAGAAAAWARLTGATNYAANAAGFNTNPEWGIVPRQ